MACCVPPSVPADGPTGTILTPLPYGSGQLETLTLVARSYPHPAVSKHGSPDNQDPENSLGRASNGEGLAQLFGGPIHARRGSAVRRTAWQCRCVSLTGYTLIMRVSLTAAAHIVARCAAALALVGCGAGQITQTDSQFSAVDGAFGNVGNSIALRNVLIPYPHNQTHSYPIGSSVPVLLSITNQGHSADELVGVDSPVASQALVEGTTQLPPGTTVTSTTNSGPIGLQPSSPLVVGQLRLLLTTNQVLHTGLNTPITFQFQHGGKLTLPVPMAAPSNSGS
jgi:periplasmic copper chaperone A